ncbi:hypothetical protein ACU4GD_10080 [Cupriavidus basilensis]
MSVERVARAHLSLAVRPVAAVAVVRRRAQGPGGIVHLPLPSGDQGQPRASVEGACRVVVRRLPSTMAAQRLQCMPDAASLAPPCGRAPARPGARRRAGRPGHRRRPDQRRHHRAAQGDRQGYSRHGAGETGTEAENCWPAPSTPTARAMPGLSSLSTAPRYRDADHRSELFGYEEGAVYRRPQRAASARLLLANRRHPLPG